MPVINPIVLELLGLGAGQVLDYFTRPDPAHTHPEPAGPAQFAPAPQPINQNNQMDWVELAEFVEMERAAQDCGCEVDCACF